MFPIPTSIVKEIKFCGFWGLINFAPRKFGYISFTFGISLLVDMWSSTHGFLYNDVVMHALHENKISVFTFVWGHWVEECMLLVRSAHTLETNARHCQVVYMVHYAQCKLCEKPPNTTKVHHTMHWGNNISRFSSIDLGPRKCEDPCMGVVIWPSIGYLCKYNIDTCIV